MVPRRRVGIVTPAYAAGIIDGEGCLYVQVSKRTDTYTPVVSVGMTDRGKVVLDGLAEAFGGRVRLYRPETKKWAAARVWRLNGPAASAFLWVVVGHLVVKGEQAELLLRLQAIIDGTKRPGARPCWTDDDREAARSIWLRVKELNHKGPTVDVFAEAAEPPVPGASLYALLVGGAWVMPQRSLFSDLGWEPQSGPWPESGIVRNGVCWTLSDTAYPSEGGGCSLSDILEPNASPRYSLSPKAAAGILRRAARRGRELPPTLRAALEALAASAPSVPTPTPAARPSRRRKAGTSSSPPSTPAT